MIIKQRGKFFNVVEGDILRTNCSAWFLMDGTRLTDTSYKFIKETFNLIDTGDKVLYSLEYKTEEE